MTMEYLYCKATGQEMEERKRWFQVWKDDPKENSKADDSNSSPPDEQKLAESQRNASIHLTLPSGDDKLGIAFHDSKETSMPELAFIDPSSPVFNQIPVALQKGWYVTQLVSPSIGDVQPKNADECVEYIAKARAAKDTKLEMRLTKV